MNRWTKRINSQKHLEGFFTLHEIGTPKNHNVFLCINCFLFLFLGFDVQSWLVLTIQSDSLGAKNVIADHSRASVLKSSSCKCISKVIWETLKRARFVDEKLAWEGEVESKDDVFFTPPKNPIREDPIPSVMLSTQVHLEVNGIVHAYIVKHLTNLKIVHFLRSPIIEQSR